MPDTSAPVEGTPAPEQVEQQAPTTARESAQQAFSDLYETSVDPASGEITFSRRADLEEAAEHELTPQEQQKREWAHRVIEEEGDSPPEASGGEGDTIPIERYKELQGWATRVNQAVKTLQDQNQRLEGRLEQAALGSGSESEREDIDLLEVFSDEKRGVEFIGSLVSHIVKPVLGQMDTRLRVAEAKLSVSDEYLDAVNTYGQEFVDNIQGVKQVMDMYPETDISFRQAYEKFVELQQQFGGTPARTEGTPRNPAVRRIPADEAQRAARMFRKDDSVSRDSLDEPAPIPKSAREAAEMSVRQLTQQRL